MFAIIVLTCSTNLAESCQVMFNPRLFTTLQQCETQASQDLDALPNLVWQCVRLGGESA